MSHLEWVLDKITEEEEEEIDGIMDIYNLEKVGKTEYKLNYEDRSSGDIFTVSVEKQKNQYGVVRYIVTVTTASRNEEIHTPESLAQHGIYPDTEAMKETLKEHGVNVDKIIEEVKAQYPKLKSEGYIGTLEDAIDEALAEEFSKIFEKEFEKETRNYESKKPVKVGWGTCNVTVSRKIVETKCYLNIPHYHYFKGYVLTLETQSIGKIADFLDAVDLIINLYEAN